MTFRPGLWYFPDMAKNALFAVVLALLVAAAYSGSLHAGFHSDDEHQIVNNGSIRSLGNAPKFFTDVSTGSFLAENRGYRPLTVLSFAASYFFSGYDVPGYHLFNILLHLLNAFLVYLIVARLTESQGKSWHGGAGPMFIALVFAVHPIQTGAVTYISGRAVLLASFFGLASFYSFLRYRAGGPGRLVYGALSLPLLFLGLLSKEMAVCVPGLMLVYDFLFTWRRGAGQGARSRPLYYYVPVVLLVILYLVLKRAMQGYAAIGQAAHWPRSRISTRWKWKARSRRSTGTCSRWSCRLPSVRGSLRVRISRR